MRGGIFVDAPSTESCRRLCSYLRNEIGLMRSGEFVRSFVRFFSCHWRSQRGRAEGFSTSNK